MHISRKRSLRRALASIVTGALVVAAAVVGIALPAAAAGVATVGVTEAPRAGGEVTVTGAGFDASGFGIYLSVRANDTAADSYTVWIDDTNAATSTPEGDTAPMSADGAFTLAVPVPAYSDAGYSIVTRGAHGIPNATNTTTTPIVYEAAPATATQTSLGVSPEATAAEGADVVLTATVSPAAAVGSVEFFAGTTSFGTAALTDGTASRTVSTLPVGALNLRAVFTPADAAVFAASASDAVPFTVTATTTEPETPTPTLTVSQAAGLDPASTTITVTGTGYDTSAKGLYGPSAGKAAGFYAQIGWLAPTWRPSEGAASSARSNAYSVWVQGTETASPYLKWTDNGDGTASFTWTVTIDKATLDAKKLDGGTLSVFTTGAGGVVQAVNEKSVRLTWAANPALSVTPSSGLDADGTSVTVTGTGYDTTATGLYGPTAGKAAGFYAQIGWLAPTWRPSEGAASSARSNAYSVWVQGTETASPYLKWTDNGDGTASFTWTVTIDKATLDAKKLAGGTLSVFTTGAGGVVQAVNEKSVALAFASTPTLSVSQTTDLAATGSTITVTGTGYDTSAKGLYGPSAGKAAGFYAQIGWLAPTWRPSEGAASSARSNAYSVWVQGTETASPYLKWTDNGDGTASFTWTVTIDKATLDAKKLDGGTLSVFTTGAGGVVQAVNEQSVALAFTEPKITVSSDTLQAGDTVTVSGIGFPAGELATVEIHSDPVTLGTALIGGTGAFSVTGIVPTTLQGTSHTIVVTAPGVSLSVPVTVTAAPAPVVEKVCVAQAVSGATIDWGMKQSFVSYINGPIAKGSVSGSWGTGSGAYNTADNRGSVTYSGTVRYTGHSGVLDLSLSQLRVQVNSTTSATLYASTSAGTIAIATLSLPAASVSADRISWSNASASLTSAGSQLFSYNGNAFYPAGTALDPVSFAFPLGAQVPCDSTTDGALAATGGGAPIDVAWIGLVLLLLGIGTVAARRRARA